MKTPSIEYYTCDYCGLAQLSRCQVSEVSFASVSPNHMCPECLIKTFKFLGSLRNIPKKISDIEIKEKIQNFIKFEWLRYEMMIH